MKSKKTMWIFLLVLIFALCGTITVSAILLANNGSAEEIGMRFDGLNEYRTDSVEMPLPLTYEATLCLPENSDGIGGSVFGCYSTDKTACFNFAINENGSPRMFIVNQSKVKYEVVFDKVNLANGKETHVAITIDRSAGVWTCYVDGAAAQTVNATVPAHFNITAKFALGGYNTVGNAQYFKGGISGVALYSDVRAADEILLDAAGGEIDTGDLIAAYAPLSSKNEGASISAIGDAKYNLTHKCDWIKDVAEPEDYAYSFAVIGDIQSMTYYYPDLLVKQFEWIRDNADDKKIAFSIGLGDITETNTKAEYQKVVEAYSKIDGVVPFSIIRGNHDRTSSNDTTLYDTYISQEAYGDEITGSYDDTMHNTYRIIQIGKVKYMFMNLDLVLSDGAIEWANQIISEHPECHVIVSTHIYKNMSGSYLVLDGKFGAENNPEYLWDNLLSRHENIVMMLYGHSPKDTIYHKQREGIHGNIVTEMLINPSETDKAYGGGGFVAMLYFSEDGEQVGVRYYSAIKEAFFKTNNQFSLTLDTPGTIEFSNVIMNVGSDESERNLTWYTQYDSIGEVQYAKSANGKLPASYSTAKATAVKAAKSGYYSYKATMVGLEANSTYVYRLVVDDVVSEYYTFNTYGMGDDFSFAFVADPQVKESAHAKLWDDTLEKIKNQFGDVSIVVSGGDQTSDPASEDNFDWFISKYLSSLAIATTVGPPHDNTQLYKDHYNLPNLSTNYGVSTPSSDYFYTYNNVLFMHLNVENHDYDGHIRFMENAINDNPDCLWRVVLLHYSFFSGGNHSTDGSVKNFRAAVAGKFNELGVDVVLSGHDHVYSRSRMMLDGSTVSGDVVTNNSVTNPDGTLYICGTSSTGSGWYSKEHNDDDAYIAFSEDTNRKSVVIFSVSEGSLTIKSYFIDRDTPEEFDRFTINKTEESIRVDGESEMLEIKDGSARLPLVNAYAYSSATVKVVGGYWSVSTDGASFVSLGIASTDTLSVLRINENTGYWELSEDGGASFESLGICAKTYTVKYVAFAGAEFGDTTDLSAFSTRRFTAATPDAPELYMPRGSMSHGCLYDWTWAYYLVGGDGIPVSSFVYGESYVAYPVASETPIASTIYIDTVSAPEEYTYTWAEAWAIVLRCVGEKITLVLKNDVTLTADDAISVVIPVDLTLDLGGKRLDTSLLAPAIKLAVGSNGSDFKVVTSLEGGTLNAGANDFIEIGSNQGSTVTIQFGSTDTAALTVESVRYLVGANGNFKYGSTLNLGVYGGSYTVTRGIIYVSNVKAEATHNVYKLDLKDAAFNFSGGESAIVRAKSSSGYYASVSSYINAESCVFTDTYKTNHTSSRFLIREDCWYGSASFTDCDFVGMSIGRDYVGAALTKCSEITIGKGCTFTNSKTTFKSENPLSFFSEKVVLASGCVIARTDAKGSAEVLSRSDAAEITWANPVGYKEYWKIGVIPSYLGESSFTVGDTTYSLLLSETPTAANGSKTYSFKSSEGYLYRYNENSGVWQISTDGGKTYTDLTEGGTTPDPTPDPSVGCTVTVGGVTTTFPADTDFKAVIDSVNISANAGKEITITLGADMTVSSSASYSNAKNSVLNIDVAGNKLTFAMGGRFKISNGYTLNFYSSLAGGELVFDTTDDGIQPGSGLIVFGSEEYKNTLTVSTKREIVNPSQLADGSKLRVKCLYSTVNSSTYGIVRINAKGSGAATLEVDIIGCTVNGSSAVILYNGSSSLGASSNGGVYTTESFINVTDSTLSCTAAAPVGFFGSANFTDRYFGTASFVGCTFNNYTVNGDLIRSDEALSYNTYYDTLVGYDPTKAITVGKGCVFYNYGDTFTSDLGGFSASNVSLADGCKLTLDNDCVKVVSDSFGCSVEIDGVLTYYPAGTDFKTVLDAIEVSPNAGKEIRVVLGSDMSMASTVTFTSISGYTLKIDLAGHKLTVAAGGRLQFGGTGFTLQVFSSAMGGELIFASGDDSIQANNGGLIIFGSENHKNMLTVTSPKELVNIGAVSDGSRIGVKYLYSTVTAGSYGILRLNAKGSAAVTLEAEITGCTVTGSARVICYNSSSTLSAAKNGGVYTTDSYIKVTDSIFTCTASSPTGFFGHDNFTDRYFGTASFVGCTFDSYTINGDLIRSDEALSYNAYYDTLVGYDPTKAITVGRGCVFYNYGDTFTSNLSEFSASNVSLALGCNISNAGDGVRIVEAPASPTITAASITIGTNLAMNYKVSFPEGYTADMLAMRFTMNGKTVTVNTATLIDGGCIFTLTSIAPQCMGDSITAELLLGGNPIHTYADYSVKAYAENLLTIYPNDEHLKNLVIDLLNYGAAAQQYVGYKTDELVNSSLGGVTTDAMPTVSDKANSITTSTNESYGFTAAGVRFDYVNKIFVKFTVADTAPEGDVITVTANGKNIDVIHLGDGKYIAYSEDISALSFADILTFRLKVNGSTVQTLTYSVNSYAYSKYDDGDAMGNLALALYRYGISAVRYNRNK